VEKHVDSSHSLSVWTRTHIICYTHVISVVLLQTMLQTLMKCIDNIIGFGVILYFFIFRSFLWFCHTLVIYYVNLFCVSFLYLCNFKNFLYVLRV